MSTPSKRPIKILKTDYGKAEGYNYNHGEIAFGRTDIVTNPHGVQGKRKRRKL